MVVLSAAICTKAGRALFARQFVPMSKLRVEGLLASFPKLLEGDSQHTFIETEDVRYVYQPLDALFVLLITNKSSNIIEDLETLRLIVKLIPEYCRGNTEDAINKHAFDLVFAVDEVITIGHKDNVTLQQIKTFTEMDSHEEKLQKIIMDSKINEAREAARKKAEAIDKQKAEMKKMIGHGPSGSYGSHGSQSPVADQRELTGGPVTSSPSPAAKTETSKVVQKSKPTSKVSAMPLSKAKKGRDFVADFVSQEGYVASTPIATAGQHAVAAQVMQHGSVTITIEEKLVLELERDGGLQKMEVKGEVKLCIYDPDQAKILVKTTDDLKDRSQFRLHPKIDKAAWEADGTLCLKERSKGFPIGSENAPAVLKYRLPFKDDSEIPFSVNIWPSSEDGRSVISAEVQLVKQNISLEDIVIMIPCASQEPPEITQIDEDRNYTYDKRNLSWKIPHLGPDKTSSSLEFSVDEKDADSFFPVNITFTSNTLYSGLQIQDVVLLESEKSTQFTVTSTLSTEKFIVS